MTECLHLSQIDEPGNTKCPMSEGAQIYMYISLVNDQL